MFITMNCKICGKFLSTVYNLHRHENSIHSDVNSDVTNKQNDESKSDEETEKHESQSQSEDEEELDQGYGNPFWRHVLQKVYGDMEHFPNSIDELKGNQYFSTFMELARKVYDEQHHLMYALKFSNLEISLTACKDWWIQKRNFDEDDALDLAWDNFKPLFKKLIDQNEDIFDDEFNERQE